jgi:hypothetical protein
MSHYVLYQGSVYRSADVETEQELFRLRNRFYERADLAFRQALAANKDQLAKWAEEAKANPALAGGLVEQRQYWMDRAKTLPDIAQLLSTYGAGFFPDVEYKTDVEYQAIPDNKWGRQTNKLKQLEEKNNQNRSAAEQLVLSALADIVFGGKAYADVFGKPTDQTIKETDGKNKKVWDASAGLISEWDDLVKHRQVSKQMNKVWKKSPYLHQLLYGRLPPSLILVADADHMLKDEMSAYGNKIKDEIYKTKEMAVTLASINQLVVKLAEDMQSPDQFTRLVALATSLVVHTGIRPAEKGKSEYRHAPWSMPDHDVIIDDTGGKIYVKTVGSAGLKASHFTVVRDDLATLEFVGKGSHTNYTTLNDIDLIQALYNLVESSVDAGGSNNIFCMKKLGGVNKKLENNKCEGRAVTAKDINKYIQTAVGAGNTVEVVEEVQPGVFEPQKVPVLTAYSFRRLVATRVFYDQLRARKPLIAKALRGLESQITDNISKKLARELSQQITEVVSGFLDDALNDVRDNLSHSDKDEYRNAVTYYINHRVILEYLGNHGVLRSIKTIVGDGYTVKLQFNPIEYFKQLMKDVPATTAAVLKRLAQQPALQSSGVAVKVTRGPAMFDFAPDDLIAWAENTASAQQTQLLAAETAPWFAS